jgi:hypothetical protein
MQVLLLSDEMKLDEILALLCILSVREEVGPAQSSSSLQLP